MTKPSVVRTQQLLLCLVEIKIPKNHTLAYVVLGQFSEIFSKDFGKKFVIFRQEDEAQNVVVKIIPFSHLFNIPATLTFTKPIIFCFLQVLKTISLPSKNTTLGVAYFTH